MTLRHNKLLKKLEQNLHICIMLFTKKKLGNKAVYHIVLVMHKILWWNGLSSSPFLLLICTTPIPLFRLSLFPGHLGQCLFMLKKMTGMILCLRQQVPNKPMSVWSGLTNNPTDQLQTSKFIFYFKIIQNCKSNLILSESVTHGRIPSKPGAKSKIYKQTNKEKCCLFIRIDRHWSIPPIARHTAKLL